MNEHYLIDLEIGNNKREPFFMLSFTCFELSLCNPFTETIKRGFVRFILYIYFGVYCTQREQSAVWLFVGTQLHRKM